MNMSAYDAFTAVLDINETIDELKSRNNGKTPDFTLCRATTLLADYRGVLSELMRQTDILDIEGKRNDSQ